MSVDDSELQKTRRSKDAAKKHLARYAGTRNMILIRILMPGPFSRKKETNERTAFRLLHESLSFYGELQICKKIVSRTTPLQ